MLLYLHTVVHDMSVHHLNACIWYSLLALSLSINKFSTFTCLLNLAIFAHYALVDFSLAEVLQEWPEHRFLRDI